MLNSVIRISIWSLFREFSLYCEHTTIISIFISYKGNTIFTCFHFSVSIVFSIHNTQSVFAEDNSSANLYSKSVTVHYKDLSSYTYPHLQIYILSSYVSKRFFFLNTVIVYYYQSSLVYSHWALYLTIILSSTSLNFPFQRLLSFC